MRKCSGYSDTKISDHLNLQIVFSTSKSVEFSCPGDPLADVTESLLLRQQAFPFKTQSAVTKATTFKQNGWTDDPPGYQTQP